MSLIMSHVFNSESCLFKLSVASTPWRMSLQWVMSLIMSHVSYSESCLFKLSVASTPWRMSLQWVMSLIMSHVSYSESCLLSWVLLQHRDACLYNESCLENGIGQQRLSLTKQRSYALMRVTIYGMWACESTQWCVCVCVCLCEYVWMSGLLCVCL